jgi:hypothetical protein
MTFWSTLLGKLGWRGLFSFNRKIYIVGCPKMKIEGTPVYFDVEGLPDRNFYYLTGIRVRVGDSTVQHSLWADSHRTKATFGKGFCYPGRKTRADKYAE